MARTRRSRVCSSRFASVTAIRLSSEITERPQLHFLQPPMKTSRGIHNTRHSSSHRAFAVWRCRFANHRPAEQSSGLPYCAHQQVVEHRENECKSTTEKLQEIKKKKKKQMFGGSMLRDEGSPAFQGARRWGLGRRFCRNASARDSLKKRNLDDLFSGGNAPAGALSRRPRPSNGDARAHRRGTQPTPNINPPPDFEEFWRKTHEDIGAVNRKCAGCGCPAKCQAQLSNSRH